MRMTARIQKIEDGVFEADYTVEPAEELTESTEYVHRFPTRAEARTWLEGKAAAHEVDMSEVVWVED